MGRKRRRSGGNEEVRGARAGFCGSDERERCFLRCCPPALTACARVGGVGHAQATSAPVASALTPTTSGAEVDKKQRLGDGKSGKPGKTLKLKLIKVPGASGSKSAPVADSSKVADIRTSTSGVAPTTSEGRKTKKKKSKKNKASSAGGAAAPTSTTKVTPTDTSAIDDLFASLKTAKQEQARADEQKKRDLAKAAQRAQQEKQQLQAHIKKLEAQSACRASDTQALIRRWLLTP